MSRAHQPAVPVPGMSERDVGLWTSMQHQLGRPDGRSFRTLNVLDGLQIARCLAIDRGRLLRLTCARAVVRTLNQIIELAQKTDGNTGRQLVLNYISGKLPTTCRAQQARHWGLFLYIHGTRQPPQQKRLCRTHLRRGQRSARECARPVKHSGTNNPSDA